MSHGCRRGVLAGVILVAPAGCDAVFGFHGFSHDARTTPDAVPDAAPDVAVATAPASCNAIHLANPSATTGSYQIDPDGAGSDPEISVTCDMTTDGGGWTLVFVAPSINLMAPPYPYTTDSAALRSTAQEALLVFRDANLAPLAGAARFPMPPEWRASSPFSYPANDFATMVSIDGATPVAATVRYGQQTFAQRCIDAWQPGTMWGRLCVTGTTAPFYTGWDRDVVDSCVASTGVFSTTACSANLQLTIAVR